MSNNYLKYTILFGIFTIPFIPFVVASSSFFPFITGKAFVFRLIIEIIFACYLILVLRDKSYRPHFSWIIGSLILFLAVIGLADIFSENPFKSFWSNFERMEGYITLLHLVAYFVVLSSVFKIHNLWNRLLATSVGASAIMAFYGFLQLTGKITINQGSTRVDGTLGNAGYLAIYMVFHIFFATFLFTRSKSNWQKILLGIVALMDLIVLYFTATRGAILGLIGGILVTFIYLLFKSQKGDRIRKIAIAGTITVLIFIGLFASIRNTTFVKENSVLSRFASLSLSEIKTQGRYYVWPMAIKGFIEKPILGWGQESFNFVFNKYYDPEAYKQEPWFDRAHSTPLDWLVAGGTLGLLSYLGLLFFLFYYLFKADENIIDKKGKAVILGLATAYVFNNLFVFDQISSYILFFTILALIHSSASSVGNHFWNKISEGAGKLFDNEKAKPIIEAVVLILLVAVSYFVIYKPYGQNKDLLYVLKLNSEGKVGTIEEYQKPLSSGMGFSESLEHVSQIVIGLSASPSVNPELKQELFAVVEQAFEKHLARVPNDARYRLFYAIFLSRYGWYGRAVEQLEIARELSPKKQQIYFELVNNLILDNQISKAVEIAKEAYESDTSYEEAKFIYGLALAASGSFDLANQILGEMPERKLIFDDRYISLLLNLGQYSEIIEIAKKRIELEPSNLQHYITLTATYLEAGRREEAIQTLEHIIALDPNFKEQGEYYINEIRAGRNP
ncbi:MAG: O-antigen ligase family protein [Candidatus Zambryskibacteria bacterium]|nr:O-antigen ligase family protein [Candidatus Zambryskibacteria bacterium]